MNPGAGDPAVSAAAVRSTGDLASAALNGMREALRARVAVVQLEGRIAARNVLLAALYGAGALFAVLASWLALQVALVLALVASGVLSMLGATIVVAIINGCHRLCPGRRVTTALARCGPAGDAPPAR